MYSFSIFCSSFSSCTQRKPIKSKEQLKHNGFRNLQKNTQQHSAFTRLPVDINENKEIYFYKVTYGTIKMLGQRPQVCAMLRTGTSKFTQQQLLETDLEVAKMV